MSARLPVSPAERIPLLSARRNAKKATSAHAYVRGSTRRFYEWLESSQGRALPAAPTIWIGGDCHVGNLGPVAAKDGEIAIELRDLDQTVLGSPAHDIVRLALSVAMAVRAADLPGAVTARVVEAISRGYEIALEGVASGHVVPLETPPAHVSKLLRQSRSRSEKQMFTSSLGKSVSSLEVGRRFWPLTPEENTAVQKLVKTAKVRKLLTSLTSRGDDDDIELMDAAYWVKGCSSLGLFRAAALVRVGKGKGKAPLSLIDIKEACAPLAPYTKGADLPEHQGERVVTGARALSPFLGERMAPATLLDHDVYVRELLPQDLKLELGDLDEAEAVLVGRYLARIVGDAHARQLEPADAATWLTAFRKGNAKNLYAPAWLWAATVDLVALHEGAYLEHCREHALPAMDAVIRDPAVGRVVSQHVDVDVE